MHPQSIIAAAYVPPIAYLAIKMWRTRRLNDVREEQIFGDVPRLPREMAATRRTPGGGTATEQRPSTRDDIARHVEGQQ